jgi:hypothetical protein
MPSLTTGSDENILHLLCVYQETSKMTPDVEAVWRAIAEYTNDETIADKYRFYGTGKRHDPEEPAGSFLDDIGQLFNLGYLEFDEHNHVRVNALGSFIDYGRAVPDCLKPLEERVKELGEHARKA